MSVNRALEKIPVVVEKSKPGKRLHWQRRALQIFLLVLAIVIPVTGLFRIDPVQGAFMVMGRQIWFSDFSIVFGFWIVIASALAMLYSVAGTVFCGWACPQNTLSEWANLMTYKLLGKRAELSVDGTPMKVAPSKNKLLNWLVLALFFVIVSAAVSLIPLLYFYEPSAVWNFMTFRHDPRLAPSLHWIYAVVFLVVLVNITMIRHFMCRFMCIYKVWQHTFRTRHTLHVEYDESRSDECRKCNYCVASCFLGIDPRKTDLYDTCINCGECITACHDLHARKGQGTSLLKFAMGERKSGRRPDFKSNLHSLLSRIRWLLPIMLLGAVMMAWGVSSYERYHIAVYRADTLQGDQILDYRISVANKFYEPATLELAVEGLDPEFYTLERERVEFETAGRINVALSLSPALEKGLHPFLVRARTEDGWEESFRVHHFSAGNP